MRKVGSNSASGMGNGANKGRKTGLTIVKLYFRWDLGTIAFQSSTCLCLFDVVVNFNISESTIKFAYCQLEENSSRLFFTLTK